jgi:hypothetical protein
LWVSRQRLSALAIQAPDQRLSVQPWPSFIHRNRSQEPENPQNSRPASWWLSKRVLS